MKEVYVEMKKVNWPTTKETIRYTLIVLAVSIAVAAFLGGADVLFSAILSKFIIK
ncbi:MAG: preprotein translocase subunit SecE [Patescibacteria group bacterium]|nr:preprotein translocase subunit SecE [Patescibacteria group bacterium]